MATAGDIIAYSDWDALYNTVSTQLGPLQNFGTEQNPVYLTGTGYGVAQENINSLPYPFERQISNITSTNNCEITFTGKHRLVQGELIFIENIQGDPTWAASGLSSSYWTVDTVVSNTQIRVGFNAFGFPSWGSSSGVVRQYHISANQFNNLRADVAAMYKHINGSSPTTTVLPIVTRGSVISYDVYAPYYNQVSDLNTRKLQLGESSVQDLGINVDRTTNWNTGLSAAITITWPDAYDIVQFFNTGGIVEFYLEGYGDLSPAAETDNNRVYEKNNHWAGMLSSVFPLFYGAKNQAGLGYSSTPTGTGRWASAGYFDISGTQQTIVSIDGTSITGWGADYNANTITVQHVKPFTNNDRSIQWTIVLTDNHNDAYAQNTTVDVQLGMTLRYTSGSIALRVPINTYTITAPTTWTTL